MGKIVLSRPVSESFKITQPFWYDNTNHPIRKNYYTLFDNHHPGLDFEMPVGSQVKSSFNGIVVRKEFHKGMGNVLGIRNGNVVALYGHLSEFKVALGDIVAPFELIGLSGNTGNATGTYPHLHFELRDITKTPLKKMVFEPQFGKSLAGWKNQFIYIVNNTNTQKSLKVLSKMYFGQANWIGQIKHLNSSLRDYQDNDPLKQGFKVNIPNFK